MHAETVPAGGLRGTRLLLLAFFLLGSAWLLAACHGPKHVQLVTVNTTTDGNDANPGDGICEMTPGGGNCSLRAAISEGNESWVKNVYVPPGTYTLTVGGVDDANAWGDLDVAPDGVMRIYSDGAGATIDANGAEGAFDVHLQTVTLERLGITGATGTGVRARGNATPPTDDLVLRRSAVFGNDGAGVAVDAGALAKVENSTISTNGGGGIDNNGTLRATFATVTNNTGGGITGTGAPTLQGSVVANQVSGANCATAPGGSSSSNLSSDSTCGSGSDNMTNVPAELGPLNGNAVPAHEPEIGSPVVDSILGVCPGINVDQDGNPRPVGTSCDRGAIEANYDPLNFVVNTSGDGFDANPGDGLCSTSFSLCSLRAATTEANFRPTAGSHQITLNASPSLTRFGAGEDANAGGDIDLRTNVTLNGNARTIDANDLDRPLHVVSGNVQIDNLTLTDGTAPTGGGLRIEEGVIATITRTTVTGNQSTGTFICVTATEAFPGYCDGEGGGAGIWNVGTLNLTTSTVRQNHAPGGGCFFTPTFQTACTWTEGAGVYSDGGPITNSTIAANTADVGEGAGLKATGDVSVIHTTIANNTVPVGPSNSVTAGRQIAGTLAVRASVVTGVEPLCSGDTTSEGYNVASDSSCDLTHLTDLPDHNALLDPLANYGGPTQTYRPRSSSPVRNLIPVGTGGLCDGTVAADQRGVARPEGPACDAGSVEDAGGAPTAPLSLTVNHGGDALDSAPGDGTCQDSGGAPGACSLRAAISEVNARFTVDTITLAPGVAPTLTRVGTGEDANATGDLDITDPLTIHGAGATLNAAGLDRALHIHGVIVHIDALEITGGSTSADGGGVFQDGGTLHLTASTVAGNTANNGAGIGRTGGVSTIVNSTISGNVATTSGGGLSSPHGLVTITASTIALNLGETAGSGLYRTGGTITVGGSILNNPGADCTGTVTSSGYNLDDDGSCALTGTGDQPDAAALVGPLAENGGPTRTHLPYSNSPALDAIPTSTDDLCDGTLPSDQRGSARPDGAACDSGSVEGDSGSPVAPLVLTVTHGADRVDALPGDGTCQDAAGAPGACSLRAAIDETNAWPTGDTIEIATGVDPVLTRSGANENRGKTGDLDIVDDLTIEGDGAAVDAASLDRVFHVRYATTSLEDVTITGGNPGVAVGGAVHSESSAVTVVGSTISDNTSVGGGGIAADIGSLEVETTIIEGNSASNGFGGGIRLSFGATASIDASTIADNQADWGGAVSSLGTVDVVNSTVTGNVATEGGGAFHVNGGTTAVTFSTVVGNVAGGFGAAVRTTGGTASIAASIFDNPGDDCFTVVTSGGYNVIDDSSCGPAQPTDQFDTSAVLGPLVDNGGPTPTHLPYAGAPSLDTIPSGTAGLCDGSVATDQRGEARPEDTACDSGAVEGDGGTPPVSLSLVVDHGGDDVDAMPGDGTCQDASGAPGACSLRAAIDETNAWPSDDSITVDAAVDTITLARAGALEEQNVTGDVDITDDVSIDGNNATVDANDLDRALDLWGAEIDIHGLSVTDGFVTSDSGDGAGIRQQGGDVSLSSLTVTDSETAAFTANDGGGIFLSQGTLEISNATISGNTADTGGGIMNSGGELTLRNSTVMENDAAWGGGLYSQVGGTTVDIVNSTFSGNAAEARGGAIYDSTGDYTISYSTFVDNTAAAPGAGHTLDGIGGPVTVRASILSSEGSNCDDTWTSAGYNITDDASCGFTQPTDQQNTNPLLDALADNGGPTLTRQPFSDSPAVDAIPAVTVGLCDGSVPTDQRGEPRPDGSGCDIGSVEGDTGSPAVRLDLEVNHGGDAIDSLPGDGICQDSGGAPGACSLRAAVDETNAWPTPDTIALADGVDVALSRPARNEDANQTGDLDVTDDTTIDGGGATIDANEIDRVLDVDNQTVALRDVTVAGGQVDSSDWGGGIRQTGGALSIERSTISGNQAGSFGYAGGMLLSDVALELETSTVTANAGSNAGGIYLSDGTAAIANSTLSGNTATGGSGGGLYINGADVTITSSTIANNGANDGRALRNAGGSVRLHGSILTNGGSNCSGTVTFSDGYNVADDSTCSLPAVGDQSNVPALLGLLLDNGGPTQTHKPFAGSPAVNLIPSGTAGLCDSANPTDQRGQPRPSGPACDAGAVEGAGAALPLALTVNSGLDQPDALPGDGICASASAMCTIRAAITETNTLPFAGNTITIAAGVNPTLSIAGIQENGNATGDLDITQPVTIDGNGRTLHANLVDRVIHNLNGQLTINDLRIMGGRDTVSGGWGAGIWVDGGTVALNRSTVTANSISGPNGRGGAIIVDSFATLAVDRSTISGNATTGTGGQGGAIYNSGTTTITNSTISGNSSFTGAAVYNSAGPMTIKATTIANNGGVWALVGGTSITMTGSVLSGTNNPCNAPITSGGYNISYGTACGLTQPTDLQNTNALLGALGNNGGPTLTQLPSVGSPARDSIPAGTPGLCDGSLPVDQRGVARPQGAACDRGSVEQ